MAPCTLGRGRLRSGCLIRLCMMPESKVAPAVRLGIFLSVFYRDIHSVECAVEISSAGGRLLRTVWESRLLKQHQFLDEDRAFWKCTRLQISLEVALFHVDVVEFGEGRFPAIQRIRRQRRANEHPRAVPCRELHLAVGRILGAPGLLRLLSERSVVEHGSTRGDQGSYNQRCS